MADTEDVAKVLYELLTGRKYGVNKYTRPIKFTRPMLQTELKDKLEMLANECGIGIEVARRLLWIDQHEDANETQPPQDKTHALYGRLKEIILLLDGGDFDEIIVAIESTISNRYGYGPEMKGREQLIAKLRSQHDKQMPPRANLHALYGCLDEFFHMQ